MGSVFSLNSSNNSSSSLIRSLLVPSAVSSVDNNRVCWTNVSPSFEENSSQTANYKGFGGLHFTRPGLSTTKSFTTSVSCAYLLNKVLYNRAIRPFPAILAILCHSSVCAFDRASIISSNIIPGCCLCDLSFLDIKYVLVLP